MQQDLQWWCGLVISWESHWLSSSWYTVATKHLNSWLHATCKQEIATSQKGNKLVDVV